MSACHVCHVKFDNNAQYAHWGMLQQDAVLGDISKDMEVHKFCARVHRPHAGDSSSGSDSTDCGGENQEPCTSGEACLCGLIQRGNKCKPDKDGCIEVPAVATASAAASEITRDQSFSGAFLASTF